MINKVLDIKQNPDKYKQNIINLRNFIDNQTRDFHLRLDELIEI